MKFVIFLLELIFFVTVIFCNDSLLSKFHQNSFKVKDVRGELIRYDENYFNFFTIKAFKYNRTTAAHNATLNIKVNVEDKVEMLVQAYKFSSNQYRIFPIRFQVNLKKTVDANAIGLGSIKNCGNFTTFYFYKDVTYFLCNFVIDETRFPPLIPNGKYKINGRLIYLDHDIALLSLFLEIYIPMEYPKK